MKSTTRLWIFSAIALAVIAAVALGLYRAQQVAEQKRLADELQATRARLAALELDQLVLQQQSLLDQITQTKLSADSLKTVISAPLNSISGTDMLLRVAAEVGVVITQVSSDDPYETQFAGSPCLAMPISAIVRGDWNKLVAYIDRLQTTFSMLYMDSAEVNSGNSNPMSLNLKVLVYMYKGS